MKRLFTTLLAIMCVASSLPQLAFAEEGAVTLPTVIEEVPIEEVATSTNEAPPLQEDEPIGEFAAAASPIEVVRAFINAYPDRYPFSSEPQTALKEGDHLLVELTVRSLDDAGFSSVIADLSALGLSATFEMHPAGHIPREKLYSFLVHSVHVPAGVANGIKEMPIHITDANGVTAEAVATVRIDNAAPIASVAQTPAATTTIVRNMPISFSVTLDDADGGANLFTIKQEDIAADGQTVIASRLYYTQRTLQNHAARAFAYLPEGVYTNLPLEIDTGTLGAFPPEVVYARFTFNFADDAGNITTATSGLVPVEPTPVVAGASNILFLPGFLTSRLYTKEGGRERRLWEPNGSDDVRDLAMSADGTSKLPVYTRDIIGSVLEIPFGATIYRNFMEYLDDLEAEGKINDWHGYAYDWRYDVFDVVDDGALKEDGSREYVIAELARLAATSKSGKVTLIAHSNGGLLAKALMVRLREEGKEDLVDKIILIASPQEGTPKSAFALLHGREIALPFIIPAGVRREAAATMPGAYGLIPTPDYFDAAPQRIATFDPGAKTDVFRTAYGPSIEGYAEMDSYLRNSPSTRGVPATTDVGTPLPLSPALLAKAAATHNRLKSWAPPADMEVHEIAGWGQPTMHGASYETKTVSCFAASCPTYIEYRPRFTNDGDDTVVSSSAASMNREVYINLNLLQEERRESWKHENITESNVIHSYLGTLLGVGMEYDERFFGGTKPDIPPANTAIGIHSPATFSVIDSSGRQTGIIRHQDPSNDLMYAREEIPGSNIELGGEGKFIIVPKDGTYDIQVSGTGSGTFSLTFADEEGIIFKEFTGVPVSSTTEAIVSLDGTTVSELSLDTDGDGKSEAKFTDKMSRKDALKLCKKEVGLVRTLAVKLYLGVVIASIELQGSDGTKLVRLVNEIRTYMERHYRNIPAERQAGIAVCIAALENSKK